MFLYNVFIHLFIHFLLIGVKSEVKLSPGLTRGVCVCVGGGVFHCHRLAGAFVDTFMGPLGPLRLYHCYIVAIYGFFIYTHTFFGPGPKNSLDGPDRPVSWKHMHGMLFHAAILHLSISKNAK